MKVYHDSATGTVTTVLEHARQLTDGYYQVEYVFHQATDGGITPYCAVADWPTSLAAQLTAKNAEIAALKERLAALEAPQTPSVPATEPSRVPCALCGELFKPRGMNIHYRKVHPDATPDAPPARIITTAIQIVDDDPTWHCAECSGNAFARSLKDPTRCTRCVTPTNGRVLEVQQ